MTSECAVSHEGFCTLPKGSCKHQKGDLLECSAKPEDLIELCPECYLPKEQCSCGFFV